MNAGVFECEIQARYRDVNLGGHVDNVEAVRIIDEARISFFRFAPLPGAAPDRPGLLADVPSGVAELMGAQRIDYHAEMRFAPFQPFRLRLWISHVGRTSFSVATEMTVAPHHPPALVAESTLVFWDHAAGSAWPISDTVRARLEEYAAAPVDLRPRPRS